MRPVKKLKNQNSASYKYLTFFLLSLANFHNCSLFVAAGIKFSKIFFISQLDLSKSAKIDKNMQVKVFHSK